MRKVERLFILSIILFSGCATATHHGAPEKFSLAENLPRAYSGTFKWYGDESFQEVSIAITKVFCDSDNNVIAESTGKYVTINGDTKINIRIKLIPETLQFEMWELDPDGGDSFETGGSHVGTISDDMKSIEAVWTTKDTGKQGDLELKAN